MNKTQAPFHWYATKAGNDHQGLVIDEDTGATIAVTYDAKNAPLIAAAPDLLAELEQQLENAMRDLDYAEIEDDELSVGVLNKRIASMESAIAKAKGRQ